MSGDWKFKTQRWSVGNGLPRCRRRSLSLGPDPIAVLLFFCEFHPKSAAAMEAAQTPQCPSRQGYARVSAVNGAVSRNLAVSRSLVGLVLPEERPLVENRRFQIKLPSRRQIPEAPSGAGELESARLGLAPATPGAWRTPSAQTPCWSFRNHEKLCREGCRSVLC
jgi:hypothetical protein